MKIDLKEITIRDLSEGYEDNEEQGVRGFGGKLDIRPAYQREFIYDDKKRNAVIHTVMNGFPLNVMYWAKREGDSSVPYEVMDGQQRTISICQYVDGVYSVKRGDYEQKFCNLSATEREQILNYKLMVYICSGNDREKLDWFETINIAGEQLTQQELRNAVYAGPFVSDAKRYFSKRNCPAENMGKNLMNGSAIRQDLFETALRWIANSKSTADNKVTIEGYMSDHQYDPNASQLWQYFTAVITWVNTTFYVEKRKQITKGIDWGLLYDKYKDEVIDKIGLDDKISRLLIDDEVQKQKGIIPYLLTKDEHYLGLRTFPDRIKLALYEKQKHRCANPDCPNRDKEFEYAEMEGDHITPWREGGRTTEENCQMLCRECNRRKGAR